MTETIAWAAASIGAVVGVWLIAQWSLRTQERQLREAAVKHRELLDRYRP